MATKPQDIGGLSTAQASGIQQIYKNKLASGMTPAQAQEAIKANPAFAKAKATYNAPAQATADSAAPTFSGSVSPIGMQKTEGAAPAPSAPVATGNAPTAPVSTPLSVVQTAQATVAPKPTQSSPIEQKTPVSDIPAPNVEKTTTTTPEGTTTVAKETPGEVKPDYNVGKGREQEILTNLNEGYKQDPAIQKAISTGDYNTFKQAYGYDTADQTKKTMLDAFFQARQPKNSESFFQTLATGQKIENAKYRESGEARDAQHRYDIVSPYKGASVDTLYNGMNSGIITPGSKAYKDLIVANGGIETPEMIMAKQKLETKRSIDKVNEGMRAQSSANKGELPPEKPDATETISNKIVKDKGQSWADKFKEMVQGDTETKELADKIKTDSLRKKEIERIRADIFKNIVKNNPGMTMGAANLKAKYESEGFDEEYNNLIDTLNVNSADLRYKTSLLEKAFDFDYKEAEKADERAYKAKETEQAFTRQKELAQFQQDLALSGNQAEFEQKIKQQAQLASDPYTAIQTVMDQYAKLGVPFTQSIATKVADANAFIAAGGTIGGYVDKMIKDVQAKPEYARIKELQTGQMSDREKLNFQAKQKEFNPNIQKIGEDEYGYFDSNNNLVRVNPKAASTGSWMDSIGDGKVTFLGGRVKGDFGMDIAGPEGFDVTSPVGGTFLTGGSHKDYGNYIEIKADDGSRIRLSHLSPDVAQTIEMGGRVEAGDLIGKQANTGTVIAGKGRGVLDITTWGADGKVRTGKETQDYFVNGQKAGEGMTADEIVELDALANITNLPKEDRQRQLELQKKFGTINDKAKKEIVSYNSLNRLLSNEGQAQGTSDKDVKYLREALSDYLKTGDENVILRSIEDRIITAKDKTPLKGISDYAKLKLYADAITKYAKTKDPNVFKAMQTNLYGKFGLPTEQTEYKTFLENGNLNEVLRIAGTSFTDAFIERLNNISISPKDTPEAVSAKLNGLLKKAELEVSGAKSMIGEETLNKIYPGAFEKVPTFKKSNTTTPSSTTPTYQQFY